MKIAHLSDIHFFKFDLGIKSFFSKDLLATTNYLINRSRHKIQFDLNSIPKLLKDKGVSKVIITGDFTTTSNLKEYNLAAQFVNKLEELGLETIIIPGNHDSYNYKSNKTKRFYQMLPSSAKLRDNSIVCDDLGEGFKYIALDTTLATPLWSSQGLFSDDIEAKLLKILDSMDKDQPVVLINHFPIVTRKHMVIRHQMVRYQNLKKIAESYSNIKLYICGHTHLSEIINQKPAILNSGSLTLTQGGSFHIMDLKPKSVQVDAYSHRMNEWQLRTQREIPIN
ncbi:MAG: 3',5'-cyclic adenosine monophosphate phosphodiesterase CpdA [Chlamydiae bacterium]|nr:3',5'-cyclic adenosine monophosphate phosphodiesterase CpdA [Chlamydiota bacterium]